MNSTKIAAIGRKNKLDTVIIPEFKIDEATFKEALAALSLLMGKESKGELPPNFIVQDASGTLNEAKVSLVMKGTPARANALLLFNPVLDNGPVGGWGHSKVRLVLKSPCMNGRFLSLGFCAATRVVF